MKAPKNTPSKPSPFLNYPKQIKFIVQTGRNGRPIRPRDPTYLAVFGKN